jgi:hypothetical protein
MHKMEFHQAYCKDLLNRILMKVISYFPSFILLPMYFRTLHIFLKNLNQKMDFENRKRSNSVGLRIRPTTLRD